MIDASPAGVLTVLDGCDSCIDRSNIIFWNGYEQTYGARSLFRYVEEHAEGLRRKYIAWIHELGESEFKGSRIIDHFSLYPDLSFWWLTLFVEQSPWKSPSIVDAIRILALEEIAEAERPATIILVSANRGLSEALGLLCENLGVKFVWQKVPRKPIWRRDLREIYRSIPQWLQGIVSLSRYLYSRWPLRRADKSGWLTGDKAIFLCSYFIHLDQDSCAAGQFYSRQWEQLPQLLHEAGFCTNWIQHYLKSSVVPDTDVASRWVRRFNEIKGRQEFHAFLDTYLSSRIVLKALRDWIKLLYVGWRLRDVGRLFRPRESKCSFWALMRRDWRASISGPPAINNLLWLHLFDAALGEMPRQTTGLYLCENQSWERAFIYAWRKHKHGRLVAVCHSTVRFWDLRYFQDVRTLNPVGAHPIPRPDLVALNGPAALSAYASIDFPTERIVECEALRYGYLGGFHLRAAGLASGSVERKVLILGDFFQATTLNLLALLEVAATQMQLRCKYTIKPHPNFQVRPEDFPTLNLEVTNAPLGQIMAAFDVACSCNATSAAVDASLAGLPVIIVFDRMELNFSPLRGRRDVRFVASARELADALQEPQLPLRGAPEQDMFFVNSEFPRWKTLMNLEPKKSAVSIQDSQLTKRR